MQYLLSIILLSGLMAAAAHSQVAVITHLHTPTDTVSKTQLLDFYTGDVRAWESGRQVVVFDLKPKNETKKLFYQYLGKSPSRMKSIWMKRMLLGEGDPPEACDTEEELLEKVANTPGAIGFVSKTKAATLDSVKTLVLINKKD